MLFHSFAYFIGFYFRDLTCTLLLFKCPALLSFVCFTFILCFFFFVFLATGFFIVCASVFLFLVFRVKCRPPRAGVVPLPSVVTCHGSILYPLFDSWTGVFLENAEENTKAIKCCLKTLA